MEAAVHAAALERDLQTLLAPIGKCRAVRIGENRLRQPDIPGRDAGAETLAERAIEIIAEAAAGGDAGERR
jgi:hypothetical protein